MAAHPPAWSVNALYDRGRWPGVRPPGVVATHPTLLPDGRRFPVMASTSDREELWKRLTTPAAEAERLVRLDNLSGAVGDDVLDLALTAPH